MTNSVKYIGHGCVAITLDDLCFMVDANLSDKLLGFIRRQQPLGIDVLNLPDVSALLVTNAHYGHLDIFSYKYFTQDKPVIAPVGIGHYIRRFLHNPVLEPKNGDSIEIQSVKITALKSKHFGFRLSGLRYNACNSYLLTGSRYSIYVAGDTAYGPHFSEIAKEHSVDMACLPIGGYTPRWLMKANQMDPHEALSAFKDLKAKAMIPLHWGCFSLSTEPLEEPLQKLQNAVDRTPAQSRIHILRPGDLLDMDSIEGLESHSLHSLDTCLRLC